ncbi:MAG: inner membrane CreD family protein [Acidobacteriota bacterium]
MTRRIMAIGFIFACTAVAWMVLGATIFDRSRTAESGLKDRVVSTWGAPQVQMPPSAVYSRTLSELVEKVVDGKTITERLTRTVEHRLPLDRSDVRADLDLEHRQKGLLWYSTYRVAFRGEYTFRNTSDQAETVRIEMAFPAEQAIYDEFTVSIQGAPAEPVYSKNRTEVPVEIPAGQSITYVVGYRSQGVDSWAYRFGSDVEQVREFTLQMKTNFEAIDFPDNTMSPTSKERTGEGWLLTWRYGSLLSGFHIGMILPRKLQPGPLAGQISMFAPVSLFFFFFLIYIITTLRDIDLHPMNYFFLAAAFFAFHLLLAYLVDQISIHLAFVLCSLVSIFLVVSYLRLVVGLRFAAVEAGLSQLIYLVLFSYAFFFQGFTGLAITIGSIITLFVVMQMTGRIRWEEKFAMHTAAAKVGRPAGPHPSRGE